MESKKRRGSDSFHTTTKKTKQPEIKNPLNPSSIINENLFSEETIENIKSAYQSAEPFQHIEIPDFLSQELLSEIQKEIKNCSWVKKKNDLYSFQQTGDLASFSEGALGNLRLGLYSKEFRNFLSNVTGIELNTTVDISASWYKKGDTLLCHDDELDGRRIAFIIYFVEEEWNENDGGSLDLFYCDELDNPIKIAKSILPKLNSIVFFAPSLTSWHQVAEVISDKNRYAISGWFHGAPLPRRVHPVEKVQSEILPEQYFNVGINEFINPEYLKDDAIGQLRKHFQKKSSVGLNDFLTPEKYEEIEKLLLENQSWTLFTPYQRRCYYSLGRWGEETESGLLSELKKFFLSTEFINFLEKIVGLKIVSGRRGEFRKFGKTNYTMVHDHETQMDEDCIDILYGVQKDVHWSLSRGGFTSYMDEDEEILTLIPLKNTLSVVFRDKGCMRFVKYVPSTNEDVRCDFVTSYIPLITDSENSNEDEDSDSDNSDSDSEEGDEIEFEELDDSEEGGNEDDNDDDINGS